MQVHLKGATKMMDFLHFLTPGLRIVAIVAVLVAGYSFIKNTKGGSGK